MKFFSLTFTALLCFGRFAKSENEICSETCDDIVNVVVELEEKIINLEKLFPDNDECATNTDNCHANAECTNTVGSFKCYCNQGYEGDGVVCDDVDECATNTDNCHIDAECKNIPGSFICNTVKQKGSCDGFVYRGKCYYLKISFDTTLWLGEGLCFVSGGKMANIMNREHQNLAMDFALPKVSPYGHRSFYIWTGMTYEPSVTNPVLKWSNGTILKTDGSPLLWLPEAPNQNAGDVGVVLSVDPRRGSTTRGFTNLPTTTPEDGVLCEK